MSSRFKRQHKLQIVNVDSIPTKRMCMNILRTEIVSTDGHNYAFRKSIARWRHILRVCFYAKRTTHARTEIVLR